MKQRENQPSKYRSVLVSGSIVVQDQFFFTFNLCHWNWRKGSAVVDANGCHNRNIQIKKIGKPASVSSSYNSVGDIVATFAHAFCDSLDSQFR